MPRKYFYIIRPRIHCDPEVPTLPRCCWHGDPLKFRLLHDTYLGLLSKFLPYPVGLCIPLWCRHPYLDHESENKKMPQLCHRKMYQVDIGFMR